MSDIERTVEELRGGCVYHLKRWSGDTHDDLGGSVNEQGTNSLMNYAADLIDRLTAERDAAVADAERYRWLRNKSYMIDGMSPAVILAEPGFLVDDPMTDGFVFEDALDAAMDAAMKEQEQGK